LQGQHNKRGEFQFIMLRIGILGGGQLGRMLLQEAPNYPVDVHILESDPNCPASNVGKNLYTGNFSSYDDVVSFGMQMDVLTTEIEHVNVDALQYLEDQGVKIIPRSACLRTIKDKIGQKKFYQQQGIQSPAYRVIHTRDELNGHLDFLPAAQKLAKGGYDGKGVQLILHNDDIAKGFDAPSVLEKLVDIDKEIAVSVAVGQDGSTAIYPAVEMVFDPVLNVLDVQVCPAGISAAVVEKANALAVKVATGFASPGLFAVEMFVDKQGEVWVNETAPRVHNSGHHTIEAHYSSQFDMLWRILLGYPLGNTEMIQSSVMLNILGAEGEVGPVRYEGLKAVLAIPNAFVHLYGKQSTKPGRKMGHVTLMGDDVPQLLQQAHQIKTTLLVKAQH